VPEPPGKEKPPADPAERAKPKAAPPAVRKDEPGADADLAALRAALKSPQVAERVRALDELGKKGRKARPAARDICELFVADETPLVRQTALFALEKIHPALYKPLVVLAVEVDPGRHAAAALEIGQLGTDGEAALPIVGAHLMAGLDEVVHPKLRPQRQVTPAMIHNDLRALAAIGPGEPTVHKTLVEMTKVEAPVPAPMRGRDALSATRLLAAQLLADLLRAHPEQGKYLGPSLIASARAMLPFESRAQVATVLGMLAETTPELGTDLAAALTEMVQAKELKAISALGKCGRHARGALPMLRELKLHPLEVVRSAAAEAVEQIEKAGVSGEK
jgi:hypothetical protein